MAVQQGARDLDRGGRRYMARTMQAPVLEREVEFELARAWRDRRDSASLHRLTNAYARYVVKIAWGFRGYGLPIDDLVQEGNVGLMEAAGRFDPERNVRFSTYAAWWIVAAIQDHILRTTSIVRVATTPVQRRLFFNLRRARAKYAKNPGGSMTDEDRVRVARELSASVADVERMEAYLSGPDGSLNATVGDEDATELIEFLVDERPTPEERTITVRDRGHRRRLIGEAMAELSPRERAIIAQRFLGEGKTTLAEIGDDMGVSKERIRQIESKALAKLRTSLADRVGDVSVLFPQ